MRKDGLNISEVASDLILAYKQLTSQQADIVISPKYEKTALYFPQSRKLLNLNFSAIEEQIEEENQQDSPRKIVIENEDDYLKEISELRKIVEQMRMKYMNIPEKYSSQPFQSTNQNNHNYTSISPKKNTKKQIVITKYQTDFLRQQYGKIQ
ncbi:unnamed protein product (macronuclear) [Paramecium tetraurelia]|uniref:Uncharacterized protein n=1 Tax=Paramecium tetraurelia TaxID=5888 RepID=A0DA15_PARTE|nr:uncharacterized protein GSPATT00014814001 [Paramecium tetraurelia]CAK79882.1 unnamed protein product [Paramecium tetraurelia]|eukprot:XP_001447279.1 hypothetical protein (macronuclear) [Paramecium tetraurelia strain d4-2]